MTQSSTCPHCGAINPYGAAFCESCGKALPSPVATGPRILTADAVPSSGVGQQMVIDELHKQSKKAFGALLAVAIMQTIFGLILVGGVRASLPPGTEVNNAVFVAVFGLAAVFFGLAFWARRSPLPAAIVGLVLFVTVHLLDAVADPAQIVRGILVKVIVIVVLVQAIQAGLKHKKLRESAATAGAPTY